MFLGQMLASLKHAQLRERAHVCLRAFACSFVSVCRHLYGIFVSVCEIIFCVRVCLCKFVRLFCIFVLGSLDFWLLGCNNSQVVLFICNFMNIQQQR